MFKVLGLSHAFLNSASDVTILIRIVTQRKEQSGLVHLASFFLTFLGVIIIF